MITDNIGRTFQNLRVSLTAACNFACTYCVPNGKRLLAAADEISGEETITAISLLIQTAGIKKVRLTGGEPLLSSKFDFVARQIAELGLEDVSITTNGQLLPRKIKVIAGSGFKRINVSLDTLNADYFRHISRSGDLATVLKGIRFIELMKMGHLQSSHEFESQFFGLEDILSLIGTRYRYTKIDSPKDSTAVRYCVEDAGRFGIIANESAPFCEGCNRLRLSANGRLYGCLSSASSHDIRGLLELPEEEAQLKMTEVLGRALSSKQQTSFRGETTIMKFIGG